MASASVHLPRARSVRPPWRFLSLVLAGCALVGLQALSALYTNRWGLLASLVALFLVGCIAGYRLCASRAQRLVARARMQVAIWRSRALSAEAEAELRSLIDDTRRDLRKVAA